MSANCYQKVLPGALANVSHAQRRFTASSSASQAYNRRQPSRPHAAGSSWPALVRTRLSTICTAGPGDAIDKALDAADGQQPEQQT
eukprot:scaffold45548_cov41-Prasinocladus_malaysianus.AAC.2